MDIPHTEVTRAKAIISEIEDNLSRLKVFITNIERFLVSANIGQPTQVEPEKIKPRPNMYTIKTLAAELGVCEKTIRRYCNEGLIGYIHIRGKIRFTSKDVDDFYRTHYKTRF